MFYSRGAVYEFAGALWKMVINVCGVCACVYTQNGQGRNLSLLTSWLFTWNENQYILDSKRSCRYLQNLHIYIHTYEVI